MRSAMLFGTIAGCALVVAVQAALEARPLTRQESPPAEKPAEKAPSQEAAVIAPFFGNEKCPLDEKPVQRNQFVEVDGQRVYACCDKCLATMKLDPAKSLARAYSEVKPLVTKGCVTCSGGIEPSKAHYVTFQGRSIQLCGAACEKEFRKLAGVWLARIIWSDAKDARNDTCPISGKPIDGVTVVIYKSTLVRLSDPSCVAEFEKDPDGALAKVKIGHR